MRKRRSPKERHGEGLVRAVGGSGDVFSEIKGGEDFGRKLVLITKTAERTENPGVSLELGNCTFTGRDPWPEHSDGIGKLMAIR